MQHSSDPVADLVARGARTGEPVAFAPVADGVGLATATGSLAVLGPPAETVRRLVAGLRPRLVWWRARDLTALVRAGVRPEAGWDVGASHRLLHGGGVDDPAVVWAVAAGLDPAGRPRTGQLDLLGAGGEDAGDPTNPGEAVRSDGHLRPDWAAAGPPDVVAAAGWAAAALAVMTRHHDELARLPDPRPGTGSPPLPVLTAWSESAAEVLAVELSVRGLPLDREAAARLLTERIGPPPVDDAAAATARADRDAAVLVHAPAGAPVDLRNPAQVRELLRRVGVDVPDTRSWRLEPLRDAHPLVEALVRWRKAERVATTYGWGWLATHVGPDDRLRGAWTGCDGAGGRMTASAGLHNLPAELRPAVVARPGHVLVRADLGQVEPRVLAAVSGDAALAAATADPDLYAPVAADLRCERAVAKVAVLAAMYGQTSGVAGDALRGLARAYPVAMAHLQAADDAGRAGRDVRTHGGRLVRTGPLPVGVDASVAGARGRFARNAVVQGGAAELFKMWAVTVRAGLPEGAEIVLCLHDELLVHAPSEVALDVVALLHAALEATGARFTGGRAVRFVADVAVVARWSDAKS